MWYEDLDFDFNPFEDNPEIRMIGYDEVIDEAIYGVHAGNIIFIEGKEGSGKTAILRRVIDRFKGKGKVVYIKCSEIKDLNVEEVLTHKYGFIKRLFSKTPKDMILLFDDIEELSRKNTERIKYFYDQNYIRSIIFTGVNYKRLNFSDSLKDRISKILTVPELDEDDAVEIVEERLNGKDLISEAIIKNAFKKSDKNVKNFLKTCEDLVKFSLEQKSEKVSKEEAKVIFDGEKAVKEEVKETKPVKKAEKKEEVKKKKEEPKKQAPKKGNDDDLKIMYEDVAERYY
ncbi:MAG: ATP-binding protein [Candidatus Nanoarchaeia archaeon]|nr:ATP-binding protein [Candidatus Nanoarchaeia archaeon]